MNPIRVLHVEDEAIQRALIAHFLNDPDEQRFAVTSVASEFEAIDAVRQGEVDLVILDYQLAQGDGLNCLRHIRRLDPILPVIALSGVADATIATDLIEAGADDFLSKSTLDSDILGLSVDMALVRSRGIRDRVRALAPARP